MAPAQLLLVLVLQFVEGLSDEQAADAVRSRIDWKYALALELDDTGFDASVLSKFRDRLLTHQAEQRLLEQLVSLLRARGPERVNSFETDPTGNSSTNASVSRAVGNG